VDSLWKPVDLKTVVSFYVRTRVLTGSIFLDYLLAPLPPVQLGLNKTRVKGAKRVPGSECLKSFVNWIVSVMACWEIRIISRGDEFCPWSLPWFV